jgi:hypothetical protein
MNERKVKKLTSSVLGSAMLAAVLASAAGAQASSLYSYPLKTKTRNSRIRIVMSVTPGPYSKPDTIRAEHIPRTQSIWTLNRIAHLERTF